MEFITHFAKYLAIIIFRYLCHEIHEEVDIFKYKIIEKCLGECIKKFQCVQRFDSDRVHLLKRINFHVYYNKEHCEMIFSKYPHVVWYRNRTEEHCGVIMDKDTACFNCSLPSVN